MIDISSRSNAKIKQVRALRQRKARLESGLFLVEGIRHVGEAVESGEASTSGPVIESIFYAPDLLKSEFAQELIERKAAAGVSCYAVTADVFDSMAEKENPQGILAVARRPHVELNDLSPANFAWGVALVDPQDPGNLGTILRTVDAVGASGLLLLDSGLDPYHPSAVRASMGAIFWYPIVSASFDEFTRWSERHAYHIFGTSAHGSQDYRLVASFPRPRILLMGSEREGLTEAQASICQALLRLPMLGRATSLNLGVATGIFLYQMLSSDQR
jgi:TrmH family RNA methyltransferase